MGPQRFYAPLGLVHWSVDANEASATVEDCRHRFRKLCQVESCCTIHVGDGHSSHGEVDDLQAAIDLLPPAGGQICLLPGIHEAAARIVERDNIVIQGCGPRSRVVAAAGQTDPAIAIEDSRDIVLRDFAISSETSSPDRRPAAGAAAARPDAARGARSRRRDRDRGRRRRAGRMRHHDPAPGGAADRHRGAARAGGVPRRRSAARAAQPDRDAAGREHRPDRARRAPDRRRQQRRRDRRQPDRGRQQRRHRARLDRVRAARGRGLAADR